MIGHGCYCFIFDRMREFVFLKNRGILKFLALVFDFSCFDFKMLFGFGFAVIFILKILTVFFQWRKRHMVSFLSKYPKFLLVPIILEDKRVTEVFA